MNEETKKLGYEKVSTLLIRFSLPAMVGMIINALYNIVDRIFIGNASHVGLDGLAGLTISFPIMIILFSVGILFGVGGATLYSIRLGENNREGARLVLGNSFIYMVVTSLVLMGVGSIFLEPILVAFGASETVLPYATSYMRVIFMGAVFQIVSMGMNNFIRADARPKLAMITMFIGATTNIVLDAIFIFGFKMGMEGAALATIIAQAASMSWTLLYFFRKSTPNRIRRLDLKFQMPILTSVISFGIPGFLLQLSSSILNLTINKTLLKYGGDNAVSAMGIVNSVQTFVLMPIFGLNQGVKPIVSYNFGARQFDRIRLAMKYATITATLIALLGWIFTRTMPQSIVSIFNQDIELLAVGRMAVVSWFWALPVVGFQIIASNFFQAVGHNKTAIFLTLTRTTLTLLPAVVLFGELWGLEGVLYAAPAADLVAVVVTGTWYYFAINSLEKYALKLQMADSK